MFLYKVRERPDKLFALYEELKKEISQLEKETDVKSLEMLVDKLKTEYFSHANTLQKKNRESKRI